MSTDSTPVVQVTRRFPFPADRVFDAWLDPALAAKWLFATPTGEMVRAEVDPRVGGQWTFVDRRNGEDVLHTGEYLEIDRPKRLVFTFGVPKYSPDFVRVTVEIETQAKGCVLTLMQEAIKREWANRTQDGWTNMLDCLSANLGDERAIANRKPGRNTSPGEVRLVRLLPGPIDRVWEYLTDPEKRRKWFAGGSMELRPGGAVKLQFRHAELAPHETPPEKYREVHHTGFTMDATILRCEPPRVLSYTWEGDTPEEQSEVMFELTPKGDDVELVLTHRRLASDRERLGVSAGWHLHVAMLIAELSGNTPPPFWTAFERIKGEYEKRAE